MKDEATREELVAEVRSLSLEVTRLRGENQAIKDSQESLRVFVMDKLGAEHGTGPFRRFKSTSTREGTFASSHFNFSPNDKVDPSFMESRKTDAEGGELGRAHSAPPSTFPGRSMTPYDRNDNLVSTIQGEFGAEDKSPMGLELADMMRSSVLRSSPSRPVASGSKLLAGTPSPPSPLLGKLMPPVDPPISVGGPKHMGEPRHGAVKSALKKNPPETLGKGKSRVMNMMSRQESDNEEGTPRSPLPAALPAEMSAPVGPDTPHCATESFPSPLHISAESPPPSMTAASPADIPAPVRPDTPPHRAAESLPSPPPPQICIKSPPPSTSSAALTCAPAPMPTDLLPSAAADADEMPMPRQTPPPLPADEPPAMPPTEMVDRSVEMDLEEEMA